MSDRDQDLSLHPAEHRAYRELYLSSSQLLIRWRRLAEAFADSPLARTLEQGAGEVRELVAELRPLIAPRGLHAGPAAHGAGASLARLRTGFIDRSVDAGVAARFAVLDAEHVATLLLQLAELARARRDEELERFCSGRAKQLRPLVKEARTAAVTLGATPDRAAAPLDPSPIGKAIHRAGWAVGSLGEWIDRRVAGSAGDEPSHRHRY